LAGTRNSSDSTFDRLRYERQAFRRSEFSGGLVIESMHDGADLLVFLQY
jgi:hypothetical protein